MSQWTRSKHLIRSTYVLRNQIGIQILPYRNTIRISSAYYSGDNSDFRKTLEALRRKTQSSSPPDANAKEETVSKAVDNQTSPAPENITESANNAKPEPEPEPKPEPEPEISQKETKQQDDGSTTSNTTDSSTTNNTTAKDSSGSPFMEKLSNAYKFIEENFRLAYFEMLGMDRGSSLNRKVQNATSFRPKKAENEEDTEEAPSAYEGPTALVWVKDPLSPWDRMKERLKDSPLIQEVLRRSAKIGKAAADTSIGKKAQEVGNSVKDRIEDVREFWETSQSPIVYKLSEVWDMVSSETEESQAISAIQKLDPQFDKESWAAEVRRKLVPKILQSYLKGDTAKLRPWFSEGNFAKVAAEIRARKQDGYFFDSNILDVDENKFVLSLTESGAPVLVGVYMVQQINCVRNREGKIVEGGEDQIRARFYSFAFQQVLDEETGVLTYKIAEFQYAGEIPYT